MTEPVLIRELEEIRDSLRDGFRGVHERLDTMNGRVRATEAITQVLGDRSERTERQIGSLGSHLASLDSEGCAVGRLLHDQPVNDRRWWKQPAAIGAGSGGLFVGLVELGKLVMQVLAK